MYLVIDTETNGTPASYSAPETDVANWPRIVQLAWVLFDDEGNDLISSSRIIRPDGWMIPDGAVAVHGITEQHAERLGVPIKVALRGLYYGIRASKHVVAHNVNFDYPVIGAEFVRIGQKNFLGDLNKVCTMEIGMGVCKIPGRNGSGYKWPKLSELHKKLFGSEPEKLHDALEDALSCSRCFFEMKKQGAFVL